MSALIRNTKVLSAGEAFTKTVSAVGNTVETIGDVISTTMNLVNLKISSLEFNERMTQIDELLKLQDPKSKEYKLLKDAKTSLINARATYLIN